MTMRRFEFVEGNSAKFWSADVEGNTFIVVYGKIGSAGQRKDKTFADNAAALRELDKKVNEKLREGYQEVTDGSAASSAAKPAAPAVPKLLPRLPVLTTQPTQHAIAQAAHALTALEAEVGNRSWRVGRKAKHAIRALQALGGINPAEQASMQTSFASLLQLVIAPAKKRRFSLRLAMSILYACDAAAFAHALGVWKNVGSDAPAAKSIRAVIKQTELLNDPELALRVAWLLTDRPEFGSGSEIGWSKRWKAIVQVVNHRLNEQGSSLKTLANEVQPLCDEHSARRLKKMSA